MGDGGERIAGDFEVAVHVRKCLCAGPAGTGRRAEPHPVGAGPAGEGGATGRAGCAEEARALRRSGCPAVGRGRSVSVEPPSGTAQRHLSNRACGSRADSDSGAAPGRERRHGGARAHLRQTAWRGRHGSYGSQRSLPCAPEQRPRAPGVNLLSRLWRMFHPFWLLRPAKGLRPPGRETWRSSRTCTPLRLRDQSVIRAIRGLVRNVTAGHRVLNRGVGKTLRLRARVSYFVVI